MEPGDTVWVRATLRLVYVTRHGQSWLSVEFDGQGLGRTMSVEPSMVREDSAMPRDAPAPPPEPPVGSEVVDDEADHWLRETTGWVCTSSDSSSMHTAWPGLLDAYGPVRLLGDPIEAGR